jgi:two-component system, OmpR family, response regulator
MEDHAMHAQDVGGREKRVLVVDDSIDTTMMMKLLLKYLGFSVQTAHDGNEALRVAEEFIPTAVLLDLSLPDMPGEEVAAELRRNPALSDALIVAISGYGDERVPVGFDHRLVKPVDHDVLLKMLSDRTEDARKTGSLTDQGPAIAQPSATVTLVGA